MPNYQRPTAYPDWTDGNPSRVSQPTPSQVASGWTAGQRPSYQVMNWLQATVGAWIGYLDSQANAATQEASIEPQMRLIGGGQWSWSASSGTLSWSQPFYIQVPGLTDSANTVAAGSVVMNAGQVGYVVANVPFTTTGTTTSGSNQLTNMGQEAGVVVGQTVSGAGIPSGTTVVALSGSTVTMSQGATTSGTGVTLTFVGSGTLTASTATVSTFAPGPTTVIMARAIMPTCIVGINAGQFVLRDNEVRLLDEGGYSTVAPLTAGVALAARQVVYLSTGSGVDSSRTANAAYPVDASAANGAVRASTVGFVSTATASGANCPVVTGGLVPGFSGLTPGAIYFADPANPGGITATKPAVTGQYVAPVGVAISATTMVVHGGVLATQVISINPWPQYQAQSQADLTTALAACQSGGGGVIVIGSSFTLVTALTIPTGTMVIGRKGSTTLTLAGSGAITMADQSDLRDLWVTTTNTAQVPMVSMANTAAVVRGCMFKMPSGSTGYAIQVSGSGNRIQTNSFSGVLGGSAAGIYYSGGSGNADDSSIFLS